MHKIIIASLLMAGVLSACDVEKPPAPETSADIAPEIAKVPKQIMDKAKDQLNQAEQLNAQNLKTLERIDAPVRTSE